MKFVCLQSQCKVACTGSYADCNGIVDDGCETNLESDPKNCGSCGDVCPAGTICWDGACGCPAGYTACGTECVKLDEDDYNCGACGNHCTEPGENAGPGSWPCGVDTYPPNTDFNCAKSQCGMHCAPGFANCNSDVCGDGCETATFEDPLNCGACGKKCAPGQACSGGKCICDPDKTRCGTSCVDLQNDVDNCGACGNSCPGRNDYGASSRGGPLCVLGRCSYRCAPGYARLRRSHRERLRGRPDGRPAQLRELWSAMRCARRPALRRRTLSDQALRSGSTEVKRSLAPVLLTALASVALLQGVASCAEGAPKEEASPDAATGDESDSGHPLEQPDTGDAKRCTPGAWCLVDLSPEPVSFNGVWGSSASDVWIAGSPDTVLHWDGAALTSSKTNTRQSLFGIWGSGPNDVWTYSSGDAIWHTDGFRDGGVEWSRSDAGGGEPAFTGAIASVWGRSAHDVWAVGPFSFMVGEPTVWHADGWGAAGPSWTASSTSASDPPSPEMVSFNAIWGNAQNELWIVGMGGKTRHGKGVMTDVGPGSWQAINSNTSQNLYAVWGFESDVWAAGAGGTLRRFSRTGDGTYSVTDVALPTTATIHAIFGSGANDIWLAGTGGTLVHWDGNAWSLVDILSTDAGAAGEKWSGTCSRSGDPAPTTSGSSDAIPCFTRAARTCPGGHNEIGGAPRRRRHGFRRIAPSLRANRRIDRGARRRKSTPRASIPPPTRPRTRRSPSWSTMRETAGTQETAAWTTGAACRCPRPTSTRPRCGRSLPTMPWQSATAA